VVIDKGFRDIGLIGYLEGCGAFKTLFVEIMNCYLTTETLRSQRNDLLFCFSLRRRKAKSIHLRWVTFLKAMSCSIIAYCGLLQPQLQLPSGFPSPPSQRRWKKDILLRVLPLGRRPDGPEAAPRTKRAVMSYSRTYPHSKAGTISIAQGLRG